MRAKAVCVRAEVRLAAVHRRRPPPLASHQRCDKWHGIAISPFQHFVGGGSQVQRHCLSHQFEPWTGMVRTKSANCCLTLNCCCKTLTVAMTSEGFLG